MTDLNLIYFKNSKSGFSMLKSYEVSFARVNLDPISEVQSGRILKHLKTKQKGRVLFFKTGYLN